MTPTEQLRQAIRESGKSANALAREIGIPQPTITTFLNGSDIRMKTADKLAAYFGLALTPDKSAKPPKPEVRTETIASKERAKDRVIAKGKAKTPDQPDAALPAVDWSKVDPKPESKAMTKVRETPPPVKGKSKGRK